MALDSLNEKQLDHAALLAEELIQLGWDADNTRVIVIFHSSRHSLCDDEIQCLKIADNPFLINTVSLKEIIDAAK